MKQILYSVCLLILMWPRSVQAQIPGNATMVPFPGTPTGNCNSRQLALDQSNGSLYTCVGAGNTNNGTWQLVAGGGGGAGVSSFNGRIGAVVPEAQDYAAFFAPIGGGGGTTGNATGLTFNGTTIPLGTPPPSAGEYLTYNGTAIVGGIPSGGGTSLLGCITPTSGNLVCDMSVQGGTGPSGLLTLPYTGTTLPSPPASASIAGIAANSNGLFWSPGNGVAFTQIGAGGGGGPGTGAATSLVFGTNTIPLSGSSPSAGHLLIYDGTNISGVDPTSIPGLGGGGGGCNCGGVTIVK